MTQIPADIFRTYDIRGIYGVDLTDEVVNTIGKGMGTYFQSHGVKRVIVGRDNRVSGPNVAAALIQGLMEVGCDVVDIGLALTPMVYSSWYHLDANAAIMITASHNPAKYNGFKVSKNKKPLVGEDYQEVLRICQKGEFSSGAGSKEEVSIWDAYKEAIKKNINLGRKMKVVIDCGNGTASLFAPEILRELGCEVTTLFCDSDGRFPNHDPYPQKVELYGELIKTIKEIGADIGLTFDGDGDRLGVYDEQGNFVENDRLAMIFAEDICKKNSGTQVVMNVSTSLSVIEHIESCGGKLTLCKTGYPFVTEKMNELGAVFGGEISGHFFFKDRYFGFDDALYAGFRALEIASQSDRPFSETISNLPRYHETREIRIELPEGKDKFGIASRIAQEIRTEYPDSQVLDFDGIRFSFSDGWGLVRPSNTEPVIGTRAEAKTPERLEEIKSLIQNKLQASGVQFSWE
jgi:phosphomannomutase/phosphoglucomutase